MNYIDDYPTCENTYATLHVYTGELDPVFIGGRLQVEPTKLMRKGTLRKPDNPKSLNRYNRWFLSSEGQCESLDSRRHIDWILDPK